MKRKAVITGLGIIAPGAIGKDTFLRVLKKGECYIKEITQFDTKNFPCKIGATVDDFNPSEFVTKNQIKYMDRFAHFAVAASRLSLEDANISTSNLESNIGVSLGVSAGGVSKAEKEFSNLLERGKGIYNFSPYGMLSLLPGSCSGAVSVELGLKAHSITISTACASALDAIGYALNLIRQGEIDIMIAGGADSCFTPFVYYTLSILGIMSSWEGNPCEACRPFEKDRSGFVLSEGAGIIVLEEEYHARDRGAYIYAEIAGYGASLDAYHITAREPSGEQASRAAFLALRDAEVKPDEIDYISAHGTATKINDIQETNIIKSIFKEHAYRLAISSIKSFLGHALGAAGGMQVVATALAIENNFLPPTINYINPDPKCDLDYVPNRFREKRIDIAMINSAGFGGLNSTIVMKRYNGR